MRILLALACLLALAACGAESEPAGRPADDSVPVPTVLSCDDASSCLDCADAVSETIDYFTQPVGDPGTPADVVRLRAREQGVPLRGGDAVVPAGPAAGEAPALVGVVRDGKVVALFALERGTSGGWYVDTVTRCESL